MQSAATDSNIKNRSKEHADSFAQFLFWSAWVLYIASLFLPAIRDEFDARFLQGWETLRLVALGAFFTPYAIFYFYVNLIFWISPWRWNVQRPRDAVAAFYVCNLFIAAAVAWHACRMLDEVSIGYYLWATSLILLTIAFCFPRKSTESR